MAEVNHNIPLSSHCNKYIMRQRHRTNWLIILLILWYLHADGSSTRSHLWHSVRVVRMMREKNHQYCLSSDVSVTNVEETKIMIGHRLSACSRKLAWWFLCDRPTRHEVMMHSWPVIMMATNKHSSYLHMLTKVMNIVSSSASSVDKSSIVHQQSRSPCSSMVHRELLDHHPQPKHPFRSHRRSR